MSDVVDLGEDKAELDGVGIREGKDANEAVGEGIDMRAGKTTSVEKGDF
jgi:hypothetical protein